MYVPCRLNRAIAHINLGEFDDALLDCDYAIERDPKYTKAYYRRGQCLMGLKKHDEASTVRLTTFLYRVI